MISPMTNRRIALITGVGRLNGIAPAVARRLAANHDLMLSGYLDYDREQGYATEDRTEDLLAELRDLGARVEYRKADLGDTDAPAALVAQAVETYGGIDTLAAVHTHSVHTSLSTITAEQIDRHLGPNVRGTLLLVKAYAAAYTGSEPLGGYGGRVVMFSSGQRLGPMPNELAYIASKGAIEALTLSLAAAVAKQGITVNAINPGPVDTGYSTGESYEFVRKMFPSQRWGTPKDAANVVSWLCSAESGWVTGQVIDAQGGFGWA